MNVPKCFAVTPPVSSIKKIHSLVLKLLHADGQIVAKKVMATQTKHALQM